MPILGVIGFAALMQQMIVPPEAEDHLLVDLAQTIEGPSVRGIDVATATQADRAAAYLVRAGTKAVPYALGTLNSPRGWAKVHGMEVLSQLKANAALIPMLQILRSDPEVGVRAIAAYHLGEFGDRSVVSDLMVAAESDSPELSRSAWRSLGVLNESSAIPLLIRHLNATVRTVPGMFSIQDETPIVALANIGDPAVSALKEALPTLDPDTRKGASEVLGQVGSRSAINLLMSLLDKPGWKEPALLGMLQGSSPSVSSLALTCLDIPNLRSRAISYFDRTNDASCLPKLRGILESCLGTSARERPEASDAVNLVSKFGDRQAVPTLIHLVEQDIWKRECISALGHLKDQRSVPCLAKLAIRSAGEQDASSSYAAEAITGMGAPGLHELVRLAGHSAKRAGALGAALSLYRDPSQRMAIETILASTRHDEVRAGAITALGEIRDHRSLAVIEPYLTSRNPSVKSAVLKSLAKMGVARIKSELYRYTLANRLTDLSSEWIGLGNQAMPWLKLLFTRNDFSALTAVSALKSPDATRLLASGLESKLGGFASECAIELGNRHDPSTIKALQRAMSRPELSVRFEAYMALREIQRRAAH